MRRVKTDGSQKREGYQWNSSLRRRKKPLQSSGFKAGTSSTLKRKTPLPKNAAESSKPASRRQGLGAGKRTNKWRSIVAKLKPRFIAAGITTCEAKLAGCWRNNGLGFGHTLKRRNIINDAQWEEVCLLCNFCHDTLEILPESEMGRIIREIIAARKTPVEKIFD